MNTMAPARAAELHAYRVRLSTGPAAAGEARGQVRATVRAWNVPVHTDVAVLLTSELVTNAVKHGAGGRSGPGTRARGGPGSSHHGFSATHD